MRLILPNDVNSNECYFLYIASINPIISTKKKTKNDLTALDNDETLALKKLKADDSIVISKPDNGQGVIILDKVDYLTKLEVLVTDRFVFKPVEENDNIQNLAKFQNFLYHLKRRNSLSKEVYQNIRPVTTSTPTLYGFPKVHKENNPT